MGRYTFGLAERDLSSNVSTFRTSFSNAARFGPGRYEIGVHRGDVLHLRKSCAAASTR
jgi:hypothetical protein